MKIKASNSNELSIFSKANLNKALTDKRAVTFGFRLGTIAENCKHYGIQIIPHNDYNEFKAPRARMYLFLEKLHFSLTRYSQNIQKLS